MKEKLDVMHGEGVADRALTRIESLLVGLYGEELGQSNYLYLKQALARHCESLSEEELKKAATFDPGDPYAHLDGKIFAISYPDSIYDDDTPTLVTLGKVLERYFPAVKGIHILPERPMSHGDLWPQDLHDVLAPAAARVLVADLQAKGVLDANRFVGSGFGDLRSRLQAEDLPRWYRSHETEVRGGETAFIEAVVRRLDAAYNSHFNDGGFSQISRAIVDPRFGTVGDIRRLTGRFAVMLDFVVNHLDIENDTLRAFREGRDDGSAFVIVSPEQYARLRREHIIEKTFRPRPFPLFTGMRKFPAGPSAPEADPAADINRCFTDKGLAALDARLTAFLSIYFKVQNDQGLTAADKRVFAGLLDYLRESGREQDELFADSEIQPQQKVFRGEAGRGMQGLLGELGIAAEYADLFAGHDDEVFGEKFFVYTTFSESQVDVNPTSEAGFRMIVDDLFHLLASGDLTMLRMDAIKYLWKEIGKSNFDMEEGNRLIEVRRLLLRLAAPRALALDEVNSPDPVVYEMGKEGGFAYLFGQVNAVLSAFNSETLQPIERLYATMRTGCPPNLVLFVMLSTHDGRSVQGLGVQRTDGHVTIEQFYALKDVVEQRGGKPKFRSVTPGEIPADTFRKVCAEAGLDEPAARRIFTDQSARIGDTLRLANAGAARDDILRALAEATGENADRLASLPAVDFLLEWVAEGRTVYEMCCTSRSAFSAARPDGSPLTPEHESARLALAQLYVLTMGQVVPAIYFNDLLGLENDFAGLELTGKPRDLNRHKSYLPESGLDNPSDPFLADYLKRINMMLAARAGDRAFYPGSPAFEFKALSDTVFLNHAYARNEHSLIIGNISASAVSMTVAIEGLAGISTEAKQRCRAEGLRDNLNGGTFALDDAGCFELDLASYGAVWLKLPEKG